MGSWGLFAEGLLRPTTGEIRDEIEEAVRTEFGRSLPMGNKTLLGFLVGIISATFGSFWDIAEALKSGQDPDAAIGALLEAITALTATFRQGASKSLAMVTLCGDGGTIVATDNIISTTSTSKRFATAFDATITALAAWVAATPYLVDDRVTHAARCYQCITAGNSAGAGGPTTTAADIVDGTVHWKYIGEGTAAVDVAALAQDTGPIEALAGDLTTIDTPVGGWTSATNLLDAKIGHGTQPDEDLRLTREAELAKPGTGTPDAIRAALLDLKDSGVTNATVFFNNTDLVDADGIPPHSCECLVQGGVDQEIFDVLWANVPVGIRTIGTTPGIAVDIEGRNQPVAFTRPTEIQIYVDMDVLKDPKVYASDGDLQIQKAIAALNANRSTGFDARAAPIGARAFTVLGVLDTPVVRIGTAPAPVLSVTIPITLRQLATFDTARVTIHTSDGVP